MACGDDTAHFSQSGFFAGETLSIAPAVELVVANYGRAGIMGSRGLPPWERHALDSRQMAGRAKLSRDAGERFRSQAGGPSEGGRGGHLRSTGIHRIRPLLEVVFSAYERRSEMTDGGNRHRDR